MEKMYPPVVNSPKTELAELITDTQTEITVANASVLLQGEGIAVIGNGDVAETITYTSVEENVLKGCVRGFEGLARAWPVGTRIARNFTAADFRAVQGNVTEIDEKVTDLSVTVAEKTQNASLTKKGVTQLSKAVNGTRDDIAATESAVSSAYGLANSAYRNRGNAPANWNDATLSGSYNVALSAWTGFSNYPPGAYTYGKLVVNYDSGAIVQMYFSHDNPGRVYTRIAFAGADWREWTEIFMTRGGAVSGTITASSPIPLASVITGQPSWVFHSSASGSFFIAPSWTNGKTDWNFDRGISVSRDNVIIATSSGTVSADNLVEMYRGVGSPEGVIAAPVGALYRNRVGGTGSTLYIKESGSGNTGWRAV
ncbi:pyocin knob domain-containing protein [Paenibacillus sp. NRS-1783]|uniref:pyocin knob domain-containing protein n=1 Tax=Paenibacillus sp. NRS-1783 TaxID=3233907 RepID=UPI003D2E13D2